MTVASVERLFKFEIIKKLLRSTMTQETKWFGDSTIREEIVGKD
jgi:hypothetical protein